MERDGHKHHHRGIERRPRRRPYNPNLWAMIGVAVLLLAIAIIVKQFLKDKKILSTLPMTDTQQSETQATQEQRNSPVNAAQ